MSLADELLADLEENDTIDLAHRESSHKRALNDDEMDADEKSDDNQSNSEAEHLTQLLVHTRDLNQIARLWNSGKLTTLLEDISATPEKASSADEENHLIFNSNEMLLEIDEETVLLHKLIRDLYAPRFPELDSLIMSAVDYARAVQVIGNKANLSDIEQQLKEFLPGATVMVVMVTSTTTRGTPLNSEDMTKTTEACQIVIELNECKIRIIDYVQSKMSKIAPNLTAIVGSTCAAELMGAVVGGMAGLAKIPACNIPILGGTKTALAGFSSENAGNSRNGYLQTSQLIQSVAPEFRKRAVRVTAAKVALASRVDFAHESQDGAVGLKMRQEIDQKIEKWQEPPPNRDVKALPVPAEIKPKRRGGKRARKLKEKYGVTELQKLSNRVAFGEAEEEVLHFDETEGLGMVGKHGATGKIRALQANPLNRQKPSKALASLEKKAASSSSSSSQLQQRSGMESSVVFTPVQGLEFVDPQAQKRKVADANKRWFGGDKD